MTSERDFNEILSGLCRKRGFIWGPSPEIYGGSAGLYDFGPLGKLLKNRIEDVIRKQFVRAEFWEVECPTVSPEMVWKASGHLDGFIDPVTPCTKCEQIFRADTLIEELAPDANIKGLDLDGLTSTIQEYKIACPSCGGTLGPVDQYNLMLKTRLGLVQNAYMRPETATTTYLLFKRFLKYFRDKMPFSVFQIGKAYRNEISPRQGMLRLREFTQVEGQIFILEEDEHNWPRFDEIAKDQLPLLPYQDQEKGSEEVKMVSMKDALSNGHFQKAAYGWCVHLAYSIFKGMGFPEESIRLRQHLLNERAHYAADAWDIEIYTRSFGWVECCGVHDRGNYDLTRHQEFSKEKLSVKVKGKPVVPEVLEIAFGVDRPLYCLIDNVYDEDEERSWLKFAPHIAPVQIAVFPLKSNDEKLVSLAKEIYNKTMDIGLISYYDQGGSIGRRYRRQDEIGTPFCVTVDYQTFDDNTVTVRDRDSMGQVRVSLDELYPTLNTLIDRSTSFESLS